MKIAGVCRQTVFTYRDTVVAKGVTGLLQREHGGGHQPTVRGAVRREFVEKLEKGDFRQARDAQQWIKKRTRRKLTESGVRKIMRRWGGRIKVPRKSHAKKDPSASAAFKAELSQRIAILAGGVDQSEVRLWVMDEHRYGLLPVIRRVWARRGVRVHAPYKTVYQWGYLHEALEVDGANKVELLFTPSINQDIHAIFLRQIAQSDPQSTQWTRRAFISRPRTPGCRRTCVCCRCQPTARSSTRRSGSDGSSRPRRSTASTGTCEPWKTT
jgi:transposase